MNAKKLAWVLLVFMPLLAGEPFIRIEYPNGGETLKSGSPVTILWQSAGVDGNVAILLFRAGEQVAVIAPSVPNTGKFAWPIPGTTPSGDRYRVRICALPDLRINDFSDRDFSVRD